MNNKYEFTEETKVVFGRTLHRIKAKVAFGIVKAGEVGGWIESERNLDASGNAWVYGDAAVYGNAEVYGNAGVYDNSQVFDNARVFDNATVGTCARVFGNAMVCENAVVGGSAWVSGDARLGANAWVSKHEHILVIGRVGSRDGFTTFYRDKDNEITVKCGCFNGKIAKFLEAVTKTHGNDKHAVVYRLAAELAKAQIEDVTTEVVE